MNDIRHRIGIRGATTAQVYGALATIEGLANWWTRDTHGDPKLGGEIEFRFLPGQIRMGVRELVPGKLVRWEGLPGGPEEWVGTDISFELRQEGDYAIVLFEHRGWAEPVEFLYHCSTKWASYLFSLKQLLETGTGAPAPDDFQISDWH